MTSARPPALWAGDLIRAVGTLRPDDDETLDAIAALLGLGREAEPPPITDDQERDGAGDADLFTETVRPPSEPLAEPAAAGAPVTSAIEELERETASWPVGTTVIDVDVSEEVAPKLVFEPLLRPHWTRAIVSSALATRRAADSDAIDVDGVVERLARGEPIDPVPRLAWPTLRRGAQVLIDRGDGMMPFGPDQRDLLERVREIAGRERVPAARFTTIPGEGWKPPHRGAAIVALTDLGIGEPVLSLDAASETEWLAFARRARSAGCPLVAFVPYPSARWPSGLKRALTIIPWDRSTTAAMVRARVGPGHDLDRL